MPKITCPKCKYDYPPELMSELATNNGSELMCPVCAKAEIERIHKMKPGSYTFAIGSSAARMYARALKLRGAGK